MAGKEKKREIESKAKKPVEEKSAGKGAFGWGDLKSFFCAFTESCMLIKSSRTS